MAQLTVSDLHKSTGILASRLTAFFNAEFGAHSAVQSHVRDFASNCVADEENVVFAHGAFSVNFGNQMVLFGTRTVPKGDGYQLNLSMSFCGVRGYSGYWSHHCDGDEDMGALIVERMFRITKEPRAQIVAKRYTEGGKGKAGCIRIQPLNEVPVISYGNPAVYENGMNEHPRVSGLGIIRIPPLPKKELEEITKAEITAIRFFTPKVTMW